MKKRVIITSGGTSEYIDDVRVLTNISTGKLGLEIASVLHAEHDIIYVHGKSAAAPYPDSDFKTIEVRGAEDLMEVLKEEVPKADVIIHAMAVSDFGFDLTKPIKLKSDDPEAFIESMRERIKINPKIISFIKEWNPSIFLVGFKFEVGKDSSELIDIARKSLEKNRCDLVVANDKEEIKSNNAHVAYLVNNKFSTKVVGKLEIAKELSKLIR